MNPYDWQGHQPQVVVPRSETQPILTRLRRGGGVWVLAGRGMGKSVFLRQLEQAAASLSDVTVARVSTAPPELSYRSCLRELAAQLGLADEDVRDSGDLVKRFRDRHETNDGLIFLFDEFDRYCRAPFDVSGNLAGRDFFNDLENTRKEHHVGLLAAGGVGSYVFRDVLGSTFLSRAQNVLLETFGRAEVEQMAELLGERSGPLPPEVVDLLMLSTGGNPALVTYGLERLWEEPEPKARKIVEIFDDFQQEHRQYLWAIQRSFADERLSGAPQRVWDMARTSDGRLPQSELKQACRGNDLLALDFAEVIDLLRAAGLVRLVGTVKADPVSVQALPSILNLEGHSSTQETLSARFFEDLVSTLNRLHSLSADFFRPEGSGKGKRLVPEATFVGVLALGLLGLGWQVEREAQYSAGRTDLKLKHPEHDDIAVVEVKIWGRNDFEAVQRQVESYWSAEVVAGAVVMLTDRELAEWPSSYRQKCLDTPQLEIRSIPTSGSPIRARWSCRSQTADGLEARVDHFLLRVVRR